MRLPMYAGVHSTVAFASSSGCRSSSTRDEPVVRHAPDERRVAAPAVRVAVLVAARLEEEARLGEPADDLIGGLRRREPVQPAVRVVEAARLVHRGEHGELVHEPELEVLLAGAGSDVDDARSLLERHLVPRDHAVLDLGAGPEVVERPAVARARRAPRPGRPRTNASSG